MIHVSCDGVLHSMNIHKGYKLLQAMLGSDFAGHDFTQDMNSFSFNEHGYTFTSIAEHEIMRDFVKDLGYIAFDLDAGKKQATKSSDK